MTVKKPKPEPKPTERPLIPDPPVTCVCCGNPKGAAPCVVCGN